MKNDVSKQGEYLKQNCIVQTMKRPGEVEESIEQAQANQLLADKPAPSMRELIEQALNACRRRFEDPDSKPTFGECLKIMELAKEHGILAQPKREMTITWVEPESISSEE
jgi:hypothetical protein